MTKSSEDGSEGGADKEQEKLIPVLVREGLGVLTIGWDLAIPIFAGVLIGHALDSWLETTYLFTLGLLTMGVMIAYYNLSRLIHRLNVQDQERKREKEKREEK